MPETPAPTHEVALGMPDELIDNVAERIVDRLISRLPFDHASVSPWMTTEEAAAYLRWPVGRVEKLAAARAIPMRKVGASVLVEAEAAEAALGFGSSPTEEVPASGEALARARRMLQS